MKIINELIITIIGIILIALFIGLILLGMWVAEYHTMIGIIILAPVVTMMMIKEITEGGE